ncbi:5-amino-6-uracil reductase [Phialemonium atrogriseum]|uniref:2,5-diamino-6-ribosylamino-4(3H)-pyrimidinone 5'-phosphate reductase n=1 Tax=Phialemonium atrogriseum TaxID=1093897 RepID=A0AAJ0BY85_9PEZI|nr:5-amino-6-uracil reductase [Phialemonium atrogriseum]KAK1766689.1 5-amino-6-uracil reductase [Phialemonium atrogriseum]
MTEKLHFPPEEALKLEPHLPPPLHQDANTTGGDDLPFVTLTFATSLDSSLALAPGVRTALSGPQSKAMTHFLRSRHAAILVGAGTAIADDPGLNCRLALPPGAGAGHQPRPIVLDPSARWPVGDETRVLRLAGEGAGLAPFVIARRDRAAAVAAERREALKRRGGKYIFLEPSGGGGGGGGRFAWADVLRALAREGLGSVMVEGGGHVINSLLEGPNSGFVDSVIVTIAPTWLGKGGVVVSPDRADESAAAVRLTGVSWHPLGEDVVMCGKLLQ